MIRIESRQFSAVHLHLTYLICIWHLQWGDPTLVLQRFSAPENLRLWVSCRTVAMMLRLAISVEH